MMRAVGLLATIYMVLFLRPSKSLEAQFRDPIDITNAIGKAMLIGPWNNAADQTVFTFDQTLLAKQNALEVKLSKPKQHGAATVWIASAKPAAGLQANPVAVCRLRLDGGQLHLEASKEVREGGNAEQLRNAFLGVSLQEGGAHWFALRTSESIAAIALDLDKRVNRLPIEIPCTPDAKSLRLEVTGMQNVNLLPASDVGKELAVGQDAVLYTKLGNFDLEFVVGFEHLPSGELRASVESYYRDRKRRKRLIGTQLKADINGLLKQLAQANDAVANAKNFLPRVERELQRAQSELNQAMNEGNPAKVANARMTRDGLARQAKSMTSALKRAVKNGPKTEQLLASKKALWDAALIIHNKTALLFDVKAVAGNHELALLATVPMGQQAPFNAPAGANPPAQPEAGISQLLEP